ncbi:MAG: DEAD/DEAH box helicase family protein, partial [Candidatus Dadabacteria bacterium]|nr:DEAD/DEAH box helicase family protein [Candidatus Dadabacteria bacterium]
MMLIDVALPISSNETFVYSVPRKFEDGIEVGKRVFVPFGNRKAIGYIVGKGKKSQDFEVKEIIDILDENPLFNKKKLEFFKWISDYYMSSIGIVLKFAHPSGLGKSLKKVVKLTKHGKSNINSENIYPFKKQILNALSIEESLSVERILNIIDEIKFEDLNSLFRRKFIELDYEVVENEKIKYEKLYSSISDIDKIPYLKKKKPAKGLILEFIHNHSRVSHHELKELFGNLNQHIKWLQENKLIKCELKEISRDPFKNYELKVDSENKLTPDQENVFDQIKKSIKAKKYSSFLLHGVTGSGKTEIYLRAIKEVLLMKKQALVLVPEISLTPLLVSRFRARFGDRVVVIHSQLSEGDRFDAWRRANRGDVDIIIGARSAIFAPVNKLGIIVVDEEHENTYKEGQNPFYNARDLALVLGNMNNCPVILGSATPSLESYSNTINGKYRY